jgi:2'-5' RNA ligase
VARLQELQNLLQAESWQVAWTDPSKFHLTLHFLGQTPLRVVDDLQRELSACLHGLRPFETGAEGLGVFPGADNPRVLWAGIRDPHGRLQDLFSRTHRVLSRYRLFPLAQSYTPHVTLGRVGQFKGWDGRRLQALQAEIKALGRFAVEEGVMLENAGGQYRRLFGARLGGL